MLEIDVEFCAGLFLVHMREKLQIECKLRNINIDSMHKVTHKIRITASTAGLHTISSQF